MTTNRRQVLKTLLSAGAASTVGAMVGGEALAEGKPVTKASLGRSLLGLADKAEKAGLKDEAGAILQAALSVIGSKVA